MEITRRKFFFFGLAAGVGLFLPDTKIVKEFEYGVYVGPGVEHTYISESDILAAELNRILPHISKLFEQDDKFYQAIKNKSHELVNDRMLKIGC